MYLGAQHFRDDDSSRSARLLCLLSSVELRNSSEFRLKPKQSEAFSAASLPAGPEVPCFTRDLISHLGISFFWSPPKPTASRSFFFPPLVGSCSLLPALSLSLYDTPTPPLDEANLGGAHDTRHSCDAWETADKAGCCVQPCLTAPLVRSLLALEQQFPTTPNNHGDMTTR